MPQVYKALVNGVQTVAVKIFSDQLSVSAKAGPLAEACRREIFLLRSCHDRNIVQCAPRFRIRFRSGSGGGLPARDVPAALLPRPQHRAMRARPLQHRMHLLLKRCCYAACRFI